MPAHGRTFLLLAAINLLVLQWTLDYLPQSPEESSPAAHPRGPTLSRVRSAVVVGGSGATGRQLVRQLLSSDRWSKVTTVSRRSISRAGAPLADQKDNVKLQDVVVGDLSDTAALQEIFSGHDTLFVCIGTTRTAAGGADGFYHVEVDITRAVAAAAVAQGVPHVSVVTSQGANHKLWAPKFFHPLWYIHTLGMKEQAIVAAEPRAQEVTIFRPGMLDRLVGDRRHEVIINALGMGLQVDLLAAAMIRDAEAVAPSSQQQRGPPIIIESNAAILRSIKA